MEEGINNKINALVTSSINKVVLDSFYPVGTIYTSLDNNFDPNVIWGGTWEKISEGVFIEATQTEGKVGNETPAGLPNIKGSMSGDRWGKGDYNIYSGAIKSVVNSGMSGANYDGAVKSYTLNFDASTGQTDTSGTLVTDTDKIVYGKSDTVQPHSISAYMWKRTN